jgi:3',5'-cyclic AMP phosphodiesterase CpdA
VSTSSSLPLQPAAPGLLAVLLPLGREQVGRALGDRVLLGLRLGQGDDLGVALAERAAVVAEHDVGELAGEDLVAAHHHVEDRLGADDLARRGDQRRVAGVGAHPRHLGQHLLDPVGSALAA